MYLGAFPPNPAREDTDPLAEITVSLFSPPRARPAHPVPPLPHADYTGACTNKVYGTANGGRGQQEPDLNTREKSGNYVLSPWEGTYSGRRALHGRGGRSLTAGSPSESGLMAGTAADDDAVFAEDVGRGRDLCQGRMIITSRNIPIVRASPGRPPSRPPGLFGHPDKPHR